MIMIPIVLFAILIYESRQACEMQSKTPPVFTGGYYSSGKYDPSTQPDWSVISHGDGKIEFKSDMFQLPSGKFPYIDLFHTFATFVSSSDTDSSCKIKA